MNTTTVTTKRPLNPFFLFTFLAAVVSMWAGIDTGNHAVSALSVLVLLPAAVQLFDKSDAKPSSAVAAYVRSNPRHVFALQVVAGAVLLWLSIDVNSTLGAFAGAALTVSSAISLIKNGRKG